jgi:hypothetical protein
MYIPGVDERCSGEPGFDERDVGEENADGRDVDERKIQLIVSHLSSEKFTIFLLFLRRTITRLSSFQLFEKKKKIEKLKNQNRKFTILSFDIQSRNVC